MKKLLLSLCALVVLLSARADEGMWIPSLIGKNYEDMQRMGLKLTKKDLYDINHSSLKDAIMQFGGGCTAEMISPNGLLLTNHHCGYDAIATLSTVKDNHLDNGFWAHSMAEELPCEGLTVIFLQKIVDVTDQVKEATANTAGERYNKAFQAAARKIEKEASNEGQYVANVKEFFGGNQYLLLIYKRYKDVRFVAAPPRSLGKFGGDTDNWMWPRHTADFSMFRVYAGKDNQPAAYSKDNVPYKPKKFLPVSIKGEHEEDYAMIFGYPGRTNRYEVSYGIKLALSDINPSIVSIREKRLAIMHAHMAKDKKVYLKLTSSYSGVSNYWKYYIGQSEQLKRLNIVAQKEAEERKFDDWANENENYYMGLMDDYKTAFDKYAPYAKHSVYYSEAFRASGLAKMGAALDPLYKAMQDKNNNKDSLAKYITALKETRKGVMKSFDGPTEVDVLAEMTKMYYDNVPKEQMPDIYEKTIFRKFGKTPSAYHAYAQYMYDNTFLTDSAKFEAFCKKPGIKMMDDDMAVQYAFSFVHNYANYQPKVEKFMNRRHDLAKVYIHGLMRMNPNRLYYPDANSTMRITYGKVESYNNIEGKHFEYFTTLDGLMKKYKPKSEEFDVPKDLVSLYKKKDYGQYADADGTLHTCFLTTDDITGGNSGSPVINANGELIGAAFDGNWEAMSGDIAFDKKYKRTIVADIRYILFLVDKMGHARNLIDEMDVRK